MSGERRSVSRGQAGVATRRDEGGWFQIADDGLRAPTLVALSSRRHRAAEDASNAGRRLFFLASACFDIDVESLTLTSAQCVAISEWRERTRIVQCMLWKSGSVTAIVGACLLALLCATKIRWSKRRRRRQRNMERAC